MPQRKPTREEIQQILTCLMVARKDATTCGVPIPVLEREYKEQEGTPIPFRELGHSCLIDLFRSMSSSFTVRQRNGINHVYLIVNEKWTHVSSLVARQNNAQRRPRGGKRPMIKRTPWYPHVTHPPRRLDSRILWDIARMARNRSDGLPIGEVLRYIQERSNTNFELSDLKLQLREINHEVVVERDVIYSLSNYNQSMNSTQNHAYVQNCHVTNNNVSEKTYNNCVIRPAGSSESSDDGFKDDLRNVDCRIVNNPAEFNNDELNTCNANDDNNNDNEQFKKGIEELNERKNTDENEEVHEIEVNQEEVNENCESGDKDNIGMLISERTKFRLEKLIQNHPEGIWCADLPDLYLNEYKLPLNYEELGFGSVSDFAAYLPDVFHALQLQDKGDFKLFDAKAERPDLKPRERPNRQSLAALHKIYETYNQPEELAVPPFLPKETCQRLIPDGVMTLGETVPQISVTELYSVTNEHIDVMVVELFTPSFFWIQLLDRTTKFDKFMNDLHSFYTIHSKKYIMPIIIMEKGLNCACKYDDLWHRGIIKTVKHDNTVTVLFYDYGTVRSYPPEEIHFLHRSFSALPAQAIPCGHYNLKPINADKWPKSAALQFSMQVMGKALVAIIASIDVDNNSMLIGLTNTEESEDFHIGDWMVQNGFAAYGRMVCIRPPNYPFRRFLECEYNVVNRPGIKSSRKLSKIVELNESKDAVKSRNTQFNLEWYRIFLELRRLAKSDKKHSQIFDITESKTRREDPKIFNEIQSQTDKNLISSCDIMINENNRALVDVDASSKFGTGLLAKMCKDHANRNASLYVRTPPERSSNNCKSALSSSSDDIIVSKKIIKDQHIDNAELAIKNNNGCVYNKSSNVSNSKSDISSGSELPEDFVNETVESLPLHLRNPPMEEKATQYSEFGNFRSIHGGHGRMQSIDWSQICGIESIENINEALNKQNSKKKLSNGVNYDELRKQRDARSLTRSFAEVSTMSNSTSNFLPVKKTLRNTIDKSKYNSIENEEIHGKEHGKYTTIKRSDNRPAIDETVGEVNKVSTIQSNPNLWASKIKLWNNVEKSNKNKSLVKETKNLSSTSESLESARKFVNIVENIAEKSFTREANEEMTLSTSKLSVSESAPLWKEIERNKENNIVVGDFHSPLGGRGRMDPCKWNDVLSSEKNVTQSSQIEMEVNENASKLETDLWTNLPKANKSFLNIVNSVLPNGYSREAVFDHQGVITLKNDVSVTVRRALKRLDEDRSDKRVRLMISDDVLELLTDKEGENFENENGNDSISFSNASKQQNATVGSNGNAQNLFDEIVRDSESSNSPKESSKLDTLLTSLSIESSVSAEKNIQDSQITGDNSLNTTPEILQRRVQNFDESEGNCESSLSIKIEDSNVCTESIVAKPNAGLLNKLSELIAAPQDSINDSALDSDDLPSDDGKNETPIKSSVSPAKEEIKDPKNRKDAVSEQFISENLVITERSSHLTIDEFADSDDRNNKPVKSIDETEKLIIETKVSDTSSTVVEDLSLQLTKKSQPIAPVFNDIDIEEVDDDDWDFVPYRETPTLFHESISENFEDIDDGETFEENKPRVDLEVIAEEQVSNCDESSEEISEGDRPLLESLENSSAVEVTDCDEISVEKPEEERPLLENESLKNDFPKDDSSRDESSLEISHAELETDESESLREETTDSENQFTEKNNVSISKKKRDVKYKIDHRRKYFPLTHNQNVALSNISKLRGSSRLVDDPINKRNSVNDSDERFSSNDNIFTRKPVEGGNDIEKIASPYSILSEVKKSKISAVASAFTELDSDSASEKSSDGSFPRSSLINALKKISVVER